MEVRCLLFHPGLGKFVTCDDLHWELGDWHSVQTVGVNQRLGTPGSDTYKMWHEQVLKYNNGEPPPHGAIWPWDRDPAKVSASTWANWPGQPTAAGCPRRAGLGPG